MAIDRVGKGPGATSGTPSGAPSVEPSNATKPGATAGGAAAGIERPFDARGAAPAAEVAAAAPSTAPLDRLRAGEIDVAGYLDIKVDQATAHLRGLPPVELDALRQVLRDKLSTDPALAELVKRATGADPPPADE